MSLALAANVLVAAGKFSGGLVTGSAAMLSESAHSIADTINELFLLASLRRSGRPADRQHPFGYGKERFFWSLLAAVGILVAGAGFSAIEAYRALAGGGGAGHHYYLVNYVVLVVAGLAEGSSWVRALWQLRRGAHENDRGLLAEFRASRDPSLKTVASEDSAALIGVVIAAGGLAVHQLTGSARYEGVASALIAILLIVVAIGLGRQTKDLLIGQAADPELTAEIRTFLLEESDAVDAVVDLLTMQLGVESILLAARVDIAGHLDSHGVEVASRELDQEIQRRWPIVTHVFIDATDVDERIATVGLATDSG